MEEEFCNWYFQACEKTEA